MSRRILFLIDHEHRLIYAWDEEADTLTILQCRYHYDKG